MPIEHSRPYVVARDEMQDGPLVTIDNPGTVWFRRYGGEPGGGHVMDREHAIWLANAILRLVDEYDREFARWQRTGEDD